MTTLEVTWYPESTGGAVLTKGPIYQDLMEEKYQLTAYPAAIRREGDVGLWSHSRSDVESG
jgi:hypothetical protein